MTIRVPVEDSKGTGLRSASAFSLLEVTIAMGIFFMATFSILEVVSQNLRAVNSLNQVGPTAGMVAAEQLLMTNKLSEGSQSGDFGDLYPDFSWMYDIRMHGTNGLFQADIVVMKRNDVYSKQSILLYSAESAQNPGSGSPGRVFDKGPR